jgi:hypothetical protein
VPQSHPAQASLITRLENSGERQRAGVIHEYETDKYEAVAGRVFTAVQFPELSATPIATDVNVGWKSLPPRDLNPKALDEIATIVFDQMKAGAGLEMGDPQLVQLHAGPSYRMEGSAATSGFGGARTGFVFYLVLGRTGLLQVMFRTDLRYLDSEARTFRTIANTLTIT